MTNAKTMNPDLIRKIMGEQSYDRRRLETVTCDRGQRMRVDLV